MKRLLIALLALLPVVASAQADQKLIDKAQKGDVASMIRLGECYEWGAGVPVDSSLALQWFQKAAALNSGEAWMHTTRYYLHGTLLPKDTARYLAIRQEWAAKGVPDAIAALGSAYYYGTGVKADTTKAVELFKEAAKKGSAWGYESLGHLLIYGAGLPKDEKTAVAYLEKAYKLGEIAAAESLGRYYASKGDFKKAWKWVNLGMAWSEPDAYTLAAQMYANGSGVDMDERKAQQMMEHLIGRHHNMRYTQGIAGWMFMAPDDASLRDSAKAMRIWQEGDRLGFSSCQVALARQYYANDNAEMAYQYARKAANKEENDGYNGEGCLLCSQMAYFGQGTPQDASKAIEWLHRGADKFHDSDCAVSLASFYEDEAYKDIPLAVKYYRLADEWGNANAMINLGKLYANNGNMELAQECFQQTVDKGNKEGYYWQAVLYDMQGNSNEAMKSLQLGDKNGDASSSEMLGMIYENGIYDVKIDPKKAAQYYQRANTSKALYRLGVLYTDGNLSKPMKDGSVDPKAVAKGMEYINQSAEQGYLEAIYALGYCYETGTNVDSVDHYKAVSYFKTLADNDVAAGQFKMGLYYELGDGGIEADSVKAIEYYQKAADQGYASAICYLGDFYRIGRYLPHNPEKAFELYQQAAAQGDDMGTYYLGRSYLEGCGTAIDSAAAIPYLKSAAEMGVGNASYRLATFYEDGIGSLQQNSDSALYYYFEGHRNGSADASNFIGQQLVREEAYDNAVEYLYTGASRGNAESCVTLALLMQHGIGIEPNPETAYLLLNRATRIEDNARAYCELGIATLQGNGCVEDEALGKSYLDTAAQLGSVLAMYDLGLCYLNGFGCPIDTTTAISWLEKAADNESIKAINTLGDVYEEQGEFRNAVLYYEKAVAAGSLEGYCNLGYCYQEGQGVVLNSQKAYDLYMVAADHGYVRGYMMVANCYINGIYVDESVAEALKWFTKAAEAGHPQAMYYVGAILEKGDDGVAPDPKKAKEWYKKAAAEGYAPAEAALGRM